MLRGNVETQPARAYVCVRACVCVWGGWRRGGTTTVINRKRAAELNGALGALKKGKTPRVREIRLIESKFQHAAQIRLAEVSSIQFLTVINLMRTKSPCACESGKIKFRLSYRFYYSILFLSSTRPLHTHTQTQTVGGHLTSILSIY